MRLTRRFSLFLNMHDLSACDITSSGSRLHSKVVSDFLRKTWRPYDQDGRRESAPGDERKMPQMDC